MKKGTQPPSKLVLTNELEEAIKWNSPTYSYKGKNIVGLGAFKAHIALWFFNGSFLSDPQNKLINAQENETKALRQWRFNNIQEIEDNAEFIHQYTLEAIENQKQGKQLKPQRNKVVVIPPELQEKLDQDLTLKTKFASFSMGEQKLFADYISKAKRAATKESRLLKITPMILDGIGLNDKYKKQSLYIKQV